MVRFTVNLPDDVFNALQETAGRTGKNLNQLVNEALATACASRQAVAEAPPASLPSLTVVEKHSYEELGYLTDVSREGIMLIAKQPLPLERTLEVLIALPEEKSFDKKVLELQIEARWYKRDTAKSDLYCVGCQFVKIQPRDLDMLIRHSSRLDLSADAGNQRGARTNLVFYLEVTDAGDNTLLGHVGDISHNGIMLIAATPLALKQMRDIRIRLPELEEFSAKFIEARVEVRWSKPDVNPELHCIGCLFVEISPENRALVTQAQDLLKLG